MLEMQRRAGNRATRLAHHTPVTSVGKRGAAGIVQRVLAADSYVSSRPTTYFKVIEQVENRAVVRIKTGSVNRIISTSGDEYQHMRRAPVPISTEAVTEPVYHLRDAATREQSAYEIEPALHPEPDLTWAMRTTGEHFELAGRLLDVLGTVTEPQRAAVRSLCEQAGSGGVAAIVSFLAEAPQPLTAADAATLLVELNGSVPVARDAAALFGTHFDALRDDAPALRRMLELAEHAHGSPENTAALARMVDAFAEFGFQPTQAISASLEAQLRAVKFREGERAKVKARAQQLEKEVLAGRFEEALATLTRRERKAYDAGDKSIKDKVEAKAGEAAAGAIADIKEDAARQLREIEIVTGTKKYEEEKERFRAFCAEFDFHESCAHALEMTDFNLSKARAIMSDVTANAPLVGLVGHDDITYPAYHRSIETLGAQTVAAVLGNVPPADLIRLASHAPRLVALGRCHAAAPRTHLAGWAAKPEPLDPLCRSGTEADFATLITEQPPAAVAPLVPALAGAKLGPAHLLATLHAGAPLAMLGSALSVAGSLLETPPDVLGYFKTNPTHTLQEYRKAVAQSAATKASLAPTFRGLGTAQSGARYMRWTHRAELDGKTLEMLLREGYARITYVATFATQTEQLKGGDTEEYAVHTLDGTSWKTLWVIHIHRPQGKGLKDAPSASHIKREKEKKLKDATRIPIGSTLVATCRALHPGR